MMVVGSAKKWGYCQDSKSVISTRKKRIVRGSNIEVSIDICLIKKDPFGRWYRLIHKKNQTYQFGQWCWEMTPSLNEIEYKADYLKENGLWQELRSVYLEKKNMYLTRNDYNHPSYICYVEAVNEVYNKHARGGIVIAGSFPVDSHTHYIR